MKHIKTFESFINESILNEAKVSIDFEKGFDKKPDVNFINSFSWTPPTKDVKIKSVDGVYYSDPETRITIEVIMTNNDIINLHGYDDGSYTMTIKFGSSPAKIRINEKEIERQMKSSEPLMVNIMNLYMNYISKSNY